MGEEEIRLKDDAKASGKRRVVNEKEERIDKVLNVWATAMLQALRNREKKKSTAKHQSAREKERAASGTFRGEEREKKKRLHREKGL